MTGPEDSRISYSSTSTTDFPDGARLEVVTTYYPPGVPVVPTPPDPAPPVWPMRVGVHDARPLDQVKAAFPGTELTRPFISGVISGPRSLLAKVEAVCRPSWTAGLVPTYSIKLDLSEVMAGRWDPYIEELAAWHHAQPACELILWHEPENDAQMRGGAFPPYFNRIASVFRAANTTVPLIYAAMAYQWLPGSINGTVKGYTSAPAHWHGVEADLHTIDIYSGSSVPLSTILPEHKGWQRWMEHVVGPGPWGVSERGFITATDYAGRADTIRRERDWLLTDPAGARCRRYIYWNTSGTEKNPDIVVDTKVGEPAVRDLVAALCDDRALPF